MKPQPDVIKQSLQSFMHSFDEYAKEIFGEHRKEILNELRPQLQRQEPEITEHILQILGNGVVGVPRPFQEPMPIAFSDMFAVALAGGNNEDPVNFHQYNLAVTQLLNRAIGKIDAGLWPPKEPKPVLIINDVELRERCYDLLEAPGKFDRVIRESTTVLEDRIRSKATHEVLSTLIPNSKEQTGENLVNTLFSPKKPVLVFSSNERELLAFFKMLLGVFSFLRNPLHHKLDDKTEWSWAWSTIGLIDRLLSDVESCELLKKMGEKT